MEADRLSTHNYPLLQAPFFQGIFWKADRFSMVNDKPFLVEGRHELKKAGVFGAFGGTSRHGHVLLRRPGEPGRQHPGVLGEAAAAFLCRGRVWETRQTEGRNGGGPEGLPHSMPAFFFNKKTRVSFQRMC